MAFVAHPQPSPAPFKSCPLCNTAWTDRSEFLGDRDLLLMGYQANIEQPTKGILLFQHLKPECKTSLAVKVSAFVDLYKGPVHATPAFNTPRCEKHCNKVEDLQTCSAPCSAAYVRSLIQIIRSLQDAA